MEIEKIASIIPANLAGIINDIFVLNINANKAYHVRYTGNKIKISAPIKFEGFNKYIEDNTEENISQDIESTVTIKRQIKLKNIKLGKYEEKMMILNSVDEFRIMYLIDLASDSKESEKNTLIIADDSPVITNFFTKIFKDRYNILVARNGEEAIKLVNENIDKKLLGLFCDLQMPGTDGYFVLDYFQTNNLFTKCPVSIISGEDSEEGIAKATNYGVIDMLQKPFSKEAAESIVNKTIQFSPNN